MSDYSDPTVKPASLYQQKLAARLAGKDPTWIPLAVDPTQQRMVGVAAHGNTPFDVPFVSQIDGNLWQGGCQNGLVLPPTIEHLISLYPWEQYTVTHELKSVLTVRMYDSTDQGMAQVDAIAAWVNAAAEDGPTLVHCQAGLNRSSLVVARALMQRGLPSGDAISLIRERRSPACLCNPAFEAHLMGIKPEG
jgi:protein-tyrosine phosphatase